jgi:glutamate racemase
MSNLINNSTLPIGVFDSGVGGLTILRALQTALPHESYLYFGDTARLPFGTKSPDTIVQYSLQITQQLIKRGVKMVVVACNTATAAALGHLQTRYPDLPIVGVIEPGARAAVAASHNQHIAILATETTITSGCYQHWIQSLLPKARILTQSCGLFVALAEEGFIEDDVAKAAIRHYISPVVNQPVHYDTVILGCTHYPLLKKPIQDLLGETVTVIDSASTTASHVAHLLREYQLENQSQAARRCEFLVTDSVARFARVGEIFLGYPLSEHPITLVDTY